MACPIGGRRSRLVDALHHTQAAVLRDSPGFGASLTALGRAPHLVGQRPVGQGFGQMQAADFVDAVEIGERAGDT
jgi:hypothetical protein